MKIASAIRRLNRIERIALVLFVAVLLNGLLDSTTGYQILGGDLLTVLFTISLIILVLRSIRPLTHKLLWRLRNRLLVSYVLFGVVPLVLIFVMLFLSMEVLFGQIAANMVRDELERRTELLHSAAQDLAYNLVYGKRAGMPASESMEFVADLQKRFPGFRAAVQFESTLIGIPSQAEIRQLPSWTKPGFKGYVWLDETVVIAAHARAQLSNRLVDVLAYVPVDSAMLADLPPDLGLVTLLAGNFGSRDGQVKMTTDRSQDPNDAPVAMASSPRPMPPKTGFWDLPFSWVSILKAKRLDGSERDLLVTVSSQPSLIVPRLFGTLGTIAPVLGIVLFAVAGVFLLVEVISLFVSLRLTRTITRTVHDLYIGTKHVAAGDFSQRIPLRSKDQLSELAGSFNSMTERIQVLIEEVKEKEKLESELEIAREVQSQLFPKDVPKLQTLELAGVCKPARVVSGDYYDFVPVDKRWTAIVIGDISGKGISAALLMASVQAALHAQLSSLKGAKSDGDPVTPSTAILVTRLNRQLYENTSPEKYASFYCALYDDSNGRLAYTNAGHLPPILIREGVASRLDVNGMVVGILPDAPYDQKVIELKPGDLLAAFTDGVTESENEAGEQFGEDRLAKLLVANARRPLAEIVETVISEVQSWAFDLDNQDDTTMLLARRRPGT